MGRLPKEVVCTLSCVVGKSFSYLDESHTNYSQGLSLGSFINLFAVYIWLRTINNTLE